MQVSRRRQLLAVAALLTAISATAVALRRRREPARPADDETARVRELYEREATRYDSMIRIPERLLFVDGRIWAASHAVGDVLEIAVGTGRNFPHYRPDVRVTGQDISLEMLNIARERARALGRDVDLCVGDAQQLGFPPERFDSVVSTLALCTIPNDRVALASLGAYCVAAVRSSCSNTFGVRSRSCGNCSGCSSRLPSGTRATICCATRSIIWPARGSRSSTAFAAAPAWSSGWSHGRL